MTLTKICTKCKRELPADTEHFRVDSRMRSGLASACIECARESNRNWSRSNVEKVNQLNREWKKTNPEKVKEASRNWNLTNPEKKKDSTRKAVHKWSQLNPDKVKAKYRKWRKENPSKANAIQRNRRARKRAAIGKHTAADVLAQLKRQKNTCYYCHCALTDGYHVDHVIPLSRGGSNGPENLVIACPSCNLSKNNKLPHEWSGSNGRLI